VHVIVLGGGVVGVTAAYHLARDGHAVTVVERDPDLASRASGSNAGMIAPGHAFAWASPAAPAMLVRSLLGAKTAIRVRPALDRELVPWGLRFLRECTTTRALRNTRIKVRLCRYSQAALTAIAAEEGIDYAARADGALYLHRDARSLAAAAARTGMLAEEGLAQEVLDPDGCVAREPAIAPVHDRIAGGIFTPSDSSGSCQAFTRALADRCRALGVEFRTGVEVRRIDADGEHVRRVETSTGPLRADHYVLSLGAQSAALARTVGQHLPIYGVRGFVADFPIGDPDACPRLPGNDEHFLVAWANLGGVLRMASTAEFGARDRPARPADYAQIHRAAVELFPDAADFTAGDYGVGFRPMTPDGRPVIGRGAHHNLVYNTGHGHMGWTMACGSGRIAADLVAGRAPEIDVSGFAVRW
jgi:D-amino-acid dehydrogenase